METPYILKTVLWCLGALEKSLVVPKMPLDSTKCEYMYRKQKKSVYERPTLMILSI